MRIADWKPSINEWDWLGHGIYFWEHSPERALRWAREQAARKKFTPAVVGAVIQLGRCFDLLDESITHLLAGQYLELERTYIEVGLALPQNRGRDWKIRNETAWSSTSASGVLTALGAAMRLLEVRFSKARLSTPARGSPANRTSRSLCAAPLASSASSCQT